MSRLGSCRSCFAIALAAVSWGCASGLRPEPPTWLGVAFPGVTADAVRAIEFREDRPIDDVVLPSDRRVYLEWRPGEPEEAPASRIPTRQRTCYYEISPGSLKRSCSTSKLWSLESSPSRRLG